MMASPIVGSSLYYLGGYNLPFIVFSAMFFAATAFVNIIMPSSVDGKEDEKEDGLRADIEASNERAEEGPGEQGEVDMRIFISPPVVFAMISGGLGYLAWAEFEPLLAIRLQDYSFNTLEIGVFFAIMPLATVFASFAVQYNPKHVELRVFIIMACLLNIIGFILSGPSLLLPDSWQPIAVGNFILGFAIGY